MATMHVLGNPVRLAGTRQEARGGYFRASVQVSAKRTDNLRRCIVEPNKRRWNALQRRRVCLQIVNLLWAKTN